LTPEAFHPAAALLPIVAGIPVAQGLYYMLGSGLELGRDVRPLPIVSFGGLVVVVLFSLLLVPATGAAGAAIATIGGWAMMALLIYRMSQRRLFVPYDWRAIAVVLACGMLIAIAASRLQTAPATVRWTSAVLLTLLFPVVVWLARFRHLPISTLLAGLGGSRNTPSSGEAGEE
jgi:O-antigen/teichoic acid export membrane protein